MPLIIDTFMPEGVQEDYDDVKIVRECLSEMTGTLLTLYFLYTE